jgi:hypothetical protein
MGRAGRTESIFLFPSLFFFSLVCAETESSQKASLAAFAPSLRRLERLAAAQEARTQRLRAELEAEEAACSAAEDDATQLETELQTLTVDADAATASVADLESQIEAAAAARDAQQASVDELERELSAQNTQLQTLRRELDEARAAAAGEGSAACLAQRQRLEEAAEAKRRAAAERQRAEATVRALLDLMDRWRAAVRGQRERTRAAQRHLASLRPRIAQAERAAAPWVRLQALCAWVEEGVVHLATLFNRAGNPSTVTHELDAARAALLRARLAEEGAQAALRRTEAEEAVAWRLVLAQTDALVGLVYRLACFASPGSGPRAPVAADTDGSGSVYPALLARLNLPLEPLPALADEAPTASASVSVTAGPHRGRRASSGRAAAKGESKADTAPSAGATDCDPAAAVAALARRIRTVLGPAIAFLTASPPALSHIALLALQPPPALPGQPVTPQAPRPWDALVAEALGPAAATEHTSGTRLYHADEPPQQLLPSLPLEHRLQSATAVLQCLTDRLVALSAAGGPQTHAELAQALERLSQCRAAAPALPRLVGQVREAATHFCVRLMRIADAAILSDNDTTVRKASATGGKKHNKPLGTATPALVAGAAPAAVSDGMLVALCEGHAGAVPILDALREAIAGLTLAQITAANEAQACVKQAALDAETTTTLTAEVCRSFAPQSLLFGHEDTLLIVVFHFFLLSHICHFADIRY